MQFSYKFYVVANFYFGRSNVIETTTRPSTIKTQATGQGTLTLTNPRNTHLSLDKRYHHKERVASSAILTPLLSIYNTSGNSSFLTTGTKLEFSILQFTGPRGPPACSFI